MTAAVLDLAPADASPAVTGVKEIGSSSFLVRASRLSEISQLGSLALRVLSPISRMHFHQKHSIFGSALHVMLLLENPICTSFIFNELRRRHCQRALLGYHYRNERGVRLMTLRNRLSWRGWPR